VVERREPGALLKERGMTATFINQGFAEDMRQMRRSPGSHRLVAMHREDVSYESGHELTSRKSYQEPQQ